MKMNSDCPLQRYQQQVAIGEIRAERGQFAAIRQLNKLHRDITSHQQKPIWLKRLVGRSHVRGMYMWGGVGTGKTMLMDMFYRSFAEQVVERIHFHRFMQSVHDAKNRLRRQQQPLATIAAQLADCHRVLCLDEFSVTDITDAMILLGLFQQLFARNVVLVTTSNTPPDKLYQGGLQRQHFLPAIALLKKYTRTLKVDDGTDYRMNRLQLESLYHVPHGDKAMHALQQSFLRLEGNMGDATNHVLLSDRKVDIIAVGCGTVWFSFATLCETSRSKMDYIELAKRFHTLILSDIPVLHATLDDAARRLIELVDELYDRGVNLIVSAAERPDNLYHGSRLQSPFQRTASRLQEMGSRDYLSRPHLL